MRKLLSAETSIPSVEKNSNNILVLAQQFLVPLMFHSAPPASQSRRLPAHDCSADLVVDIGPVAGIHLAPPAAHDVEFHVTAQALVAVMASPALPADLLSPAKAQVTKRLRASIKQDIKNITDMAEASRASYYKDALHHAECKGLSFSTKDFKSDDQDRQIDLLVQVLPDDCIKRLLNEDWDSLNSMEPSILLPPENFRVLSTPPTQTDVKLNLKPRSFISLSVSLFSTRYQSQFSEVQSSQAHF